MGSYYEDSLSGERLQRCYEIAPPRIRKYLRAEIEFVVGQLRGADPVLEFGCGYGRVLREIARVASRVVGCDISRPSLERAKSYLRPRRNVALVRTDAAQLAFAAGTFGAVLCVQNGISAFGVDRQRLASEAVRVAKNGGQILFSSYSPRIWTARLDWFRIQAQAGLIGPIDEARTGDGTIVCTDGFRAGTVGRGEFERLFEGRGTHMEVREVDASSLFCIVRK